MAVPLVETIQTIHSVACRIRKASSTPADADLLDSAADQIVRVVTQEVATRERQIYELELRFRTALESGSRWTPLSDL